MVSLSKRGIKAFFAVALLAASFLTGCSNGEGGSTTAATPPTSSTAPSDPPPPDPQIVVTVTPATASISTIQTQLFQATVVNSKNPAVRWQVDSVQDGNVNVGIISAAGLYTPSPREATYSITATSVEDPTNSGSANVTVKFPPPPIAVVVTPATTSISTIQTQRFTAAVTNSTNSAVSWSVDGVRGGNVNVGVISSDGLYTPSPSAGTHVVSAASVVDPTKSSSATITVQLPPIAVTVTPVTASISTIQTQQFAASVVNSKNPAVTWQVDGVQGGNATAGVISPAGLYAPPAREAIHSITAVSIEDPTKSDSANITVKFPPPQIAVAVTPATASISTIQTQAFTAVVSNNANSAVTWQVDSVQGGNANVGVISSNGLYTPPSSAATHVVSATSVADTTKSGSATIAVQLPPIAVTVTPATASISTIQTQQFAATVAYSTNSAVIWNVDGIPGGSANVGLISANGRYSAPPSESIHMISAVSVGDPGKSDSASITVKLLSGTLTYHNDNARSGQNLREMVLTPSNVGTATFGKLFSFPVDGAVYAQPLYVSNVPLAGQLHNVVFVATEHNSVYAFDADNKTGTPLWHASFIDPANGITTVPSKDTNCADINPEIGITSTPVIDPVKGTLYVVAMTKENGTYAHRIHALDITTGNDAFGTGTKIQASVPGTAAPNDGMGRLVFNSLLENQRAALLLSNNVLYVSVGSFCDLGNHHGWLLAYDAQTLNLLGAFSSTPNGTEGGIWQSGGGAAADANGDIYVITGDGSFDAASGGNNYGNTFLRFTGASLAVSDYFTPFNQATLEAVNGDLGSGGALLLPDQSAGPTHLLVSAGKQGVVYLLNRDGMGKFQVGSDSQIVQSFPGGSCGAGACALFSTPAYFNNTVYMAAAQDKLKAYTLSNGQLSLATQSTFAFGWPGATTVVSANGSSNGIVWALETNGSGAPAVLHAYSAADVSIELYNSNQNSARDYPGPAVKFAVPTIANGKVYVGAQGQLSVFGLLP